MLNKEYFEFTDKEAGLSFLKDAVTLRKSMGGALYWNIVNDDCNKIADRCLSYGATEEEVREILNE